ncbi:hypothetical protein 8014-B2_0053 [Lactobacillus phage ATCC 8014-B2]|uniref:Uncharacterized protein n=1 Tax=Lactobacillus phage ATCC 8014-B2 TaxID=1225795 RepID=K4I4D5_9CAUD|nr:hypothetical protein HOQ89_gp093 [Lactobacillus phage ATCC 8014-B2]AFU63120.1 hypothetical protein 8014-B2_0053 [Lactobacillus phage ATCC 8014-B2]
MKKTYRQKGTVIAEQFDGSKEMCDKYWIYKKAKGFSVHAKNPYGRDLNVREDDEFYLTSVNGNQKINIGDWIVKDKELPILPRRVITDYDFNSSYEEEK